MTRDELYQRLSAAGYHVSYRQLPRIIAYALNQPQAGRPAGRPGHREYAEADYRLVVAWLRVHELCGDDRGDHQDPGHKLRREAVELLADHGWGYVWISGGEVGWSELPPIFTLRAGGTGVTTCWAVQD